MKAPTKNLNRTRLIGLTAMGVCVLGYGGMGLFLLLGKTGQMEMVTAALLAATVGLIGEIGLWVGAACLGLSLFRKRKAMVDRLLVRLRGHRQPVDTQV